MDPDTIVGTLAALLTTLANIPQLKKSWQGSTRDLSLRTYVILATGVAMWVLYGVLKRDAVIIVANVAGLAMLLTILGLKLREMAGARKRR
jgi:MtN3 and saliva related transmembrane protein